MECMTRTRQNGRDELHRCVETTCSRQRATKNVQRTSCNRPYVADNMQQPADGAHKTARSGNAHTFPLRLSPHRRRRRAPERVEGLEAKPQGARLVLRARLPPAACAAPIPLPNPPCARTYARVCAAAWLRGCVCVASRVRGCVAARLRVCAWLRVCVAACLRSCAQSLLRVCAPTIRAGSGHAPHATFSHN